jgi:hypothetical protein
MGIIFEELAVVLQSGVVIDGFEDVFTFNGEEEEQLDLWRDVALVLGYVHQEVAHVGLELSQSSLLGLTEAGRLQLGHTLIDVLLFEGV